ncbi:major capsid protein [Capybara microvirus Cap3_SP_344]|nr:major capsid protein [Capybara microvirus Cap3_SP_344]
MKVNIGNPLHDVGRVGRFNLSCDSLATTKFGQLKPVYAKELPPNVGISAHCQSTVLLSPLAVPTAGKFLLKTYWSWFDYSTIFPWWKAFRAHTVYRFSSSAKVPVVPMIYYHELYANLINDYRFNRSGTYNNGKRVFSTYVYADWDCSISPVDVFTYVNNYRFRNLFGLQYFYLVKPNGKVYEVHTSGWSAGTSWTVTELALDEEALVSFAPLVKVSSDLDYTFENERHFYVKYGKNHAYINDILIGLGYPSYPIQKKVNPFKLIAFYKSYFDLFGIQRKYNFSNTSFGQLIAHLNSDNTITSSFPWSSAGMELLDCVYTTGSDYFTSQYVSLADNQASGALAATTLKTAESTEGGSYSVWTTPQGGTAMPSGQSNLGITQLLAEKLLRYVNINSILGQNYANWVYAKFGVKKNTDPLSVSTYLTSGSVPIQVSTVFNQTQAENSAALGSYAGRGLGNGRSADLKFQTSGDGVLLALQTVVPEPGYYQGCSPDIFRENQYDFYDIEFDSAGYTGTTMAEFVSDYPASSTYFDKLFGLRPRYMEYKVKNNQIIGNFRQKSMRPSMSGYFCDRMFAEAISGETLYQADDMRLRQFDSSNDLFNFGRIFAYTEQESTVDPFLCFNSFDVLMTGRMIEIKDSWVNTQQEGNYNVESC